jgi:hypothetical protein
MRKILSNRTEKLPYLYNLGLRIGIDLIGSFDDTPVSSAPKIIAI